MQALSLAIGPAGRVAFTRQLVADELANELSNLRPQNRSVGVPDFSSRGNFYRFSNVKVDLTNGYLENFHPAFDSITQAGGGTFPLTLVARAFSAVFDWHESWHQHYCHKVCTDEDKNASFKYRPGIGTLTTNVTLGFAYDAPTNSYQIVVSGKPSAQTAGIQANVPGNSILQDEDHDCTSSHVSDATAAALSQLGFGQTVQDVFRPLIKSVAASGHLSDDIVYDFGIGDSKITFPQDTGIAIGITGGVTYKGTPYPGTKPTGLPVPPPPTDSHHIQLYVSNYEFNALHWAYAQAGKLDVTLYPADLPDGDVLQVRTYASYIKSLAPYRAFAMRADIRPKKSPEVSFQKVWVLGKEALAVLQRQLPADVYALLEGLVGCYVSQAALDADLKDATIGQQYWPVVERASYAPGMAMKQNLEFTLAILNDAPTKPTIVFDVARTDVLQDLGLGRTAAPGSPAQTLKFSFRHATYDATFVSTTVPGFDKVDFGGEIWPVVGEPAYDRTLVALGNIGAPLPIMDGFEFLFDQAQLSIQEGFVSILANVAYKKA